MEFDYEKISETLDELCRIALAIHIRNGKIESAESMSRSFSGVLGIDAEADVDKKTAPYREKNEELINKFNQLKATL